jgi:hypothetical protein
MPAYVLDLEITEDLMGLVDLQIHGGPHFRSQQ